MAKTHAHREVQALLKRAFRYPGGKADPSMWWRDAELRRDLVVALAGLHATSQPTVVAGVEARGFLVGGLVAAELGIGFAEVRKEVKPGEVGEGLVRRVSPPDYLGRSLDLSMRRHLLAERDRVLFVDEWLDTGAQVSTVARLVEDVGATWVGAAVIVDVGPNDVRHRLDVRSLLRSHDLPW